MGGEVDEGDKMEWGAVVMHPNAITERAISDRELRSTVFIARVLGVELPHTTVLFADKPKFAKAVFQVRQAMKGGEGVEANGRKLEEAGVPLEWIGWLLSVRTGYIMRRHMDRF